MGIYDRDYYRNEPRRVGVGDWSAVTTLIVINAAIWIADQFTPRDWFVTKMELLPDLFAHPWQAWQLLTYGFAHDPRSIQHILFNMFGLWVFGRDVEGIYGRAEFYRVYLSLLVLSGLVWVIFQRLFWPDNPSPAIGASGAVMGIMMIYIFHFPHRTFLLFFAIPVPAWVLGIIYVFFDLGGATGTFQLTKEHVANTAHLGGALFGFLYYQTHWTLFSLLPGRWISQTFRRPKYRVHRGDDDPRDPRQLQQEVDEILAKIHREGEASLTAAERRTLEEASRRYRDQGPGTRS